MRIPLSTKGDYLGGKRLILPISIHGRGIFLATDALFDTGSQESIIMQSDLETKTRIPFKQYKLVKTKNIANTTVNLIDLGELELNLRDVEGKIVSLKHRFYGGVFPEGKNIKKIVMPTLIGMDFLDGYNFGITPRDSNDMRYLYTNG